jgi:hypothetical protein
MQLKIVVPADFVKKDCVHCGPHALLGTSPPSLEQLI